MALTCCVKDCSNGAYWLKKWKLQLCNVCGCLHGDKLCTCETPFRLFTFPTKKKNPETRERWKQVVGRQDGNKLWSPPKDSRVCSKHFVDSQPTSENPLPTLQMGYDGAEKRVKRMIQFESTRHRPSKKKFYVQVINSDCAEAAGGPRPFEDPEMETLSNEPESMPWIFTILTVLVCLFMFVQKQNDKIVQLKAEVQMLRQKVAKLKNTLYAEVILKTDEDVFFSQDYRTSQFSTNSIPSLPRMSTEGGQV